jgi:hypothetical protein
MYEIVLHLGCKVSFLCAGAGEVSLILEHWDICASFPVFLFVKEYLPLLTAMPACPEVQCWLKERR